MTQSGNRRQEVTNAFLIALVGQVGCLTLVIIVASLLGGFWLDRVLGSRPLFTLLFLLAGTPLSVIAMLVVARRALAKLKTSSQTSEDHPSS